MPLVKRVLAVALCVFAASLAHAQKRRALLIGINDYSASRLSARASSAAPGREWPDLTGAVNDVKALQTILVSAYGFRAQDIVTLTDQQATRDAILHSLEHHLVQPTQKSDVVFFYYAGHGSQVVNSRSDEPDGRDESIVPADSRRGAPDIRDKELRRFFNRIADRDARLTILLDHCYSGSGARGLDAGLRTRGINPDLRDVRDATDYGPRPERRGALVVSASQDFDMSREAVDDQGQPHGAFTLAWMRALRDAAENEPAAETFARAAARLKASMPFQEPVLAGTSAARNAPFLGTRTDRRRGRTVVGVSHVNDDGTVRLHGGWANGLSIGTELRLADNPSAPRFTVTSIRGLVRAEARIVGVRGLPSGIHSGALLEVVAWAAPPVRPMRVWVPRFNGNATALQSVAQKLAADAANRGLRWIADPTEHAPALTLRRLDSMAEAQRGAAVFVQFPVPPNLAIDFATNGIAAASRVEEADYILTGRYANGGLSYAWVRPGVTRAEHAKSGLPSRTAWTSSPDELRESLLRLRRIHAWLVLEPPPASRAPYRLLLRDANGASVNGTRLTGDREYTLALRSTNARVNGRRYAYVFVIDSDGAGTLLFPRDGSVENDVTGDTPQLAKFIVAPPYGVDTYILLITDEPLPNPWALTWDGVRANLGAMRSEWTIERVAFEAVPP